MCIFMLYYKQRVFAPSDRVIIFTHSFIEWVFLGSKEERLLLVKYRIMKSL